MVWIMNGMKNTEEYNFVDCLYINVLQKFGGIFLIFMLMLFTYANKSLLKNKDYLGLIIMMFLAYQGLIDNLNIYLYFNSFLFLVSDGIYRDIIYKLNTRKDKKKQNEKKFDQKLYI